MMRVKMLLLTSLILLGFLTGCSRKVAVLDYERTSEEKTEKIRLDYRKKTFVYYAESAKDNYVAKGSFYIDGSNIVFRFPEYSESAILGPFEKGFYHLEKLGESDVVQLLPSILELETQFPAPFVQGLIVSKVDSTILYAIDDFTQGITTLRVGDYLFIQGGLFYYDQYIRIPDKGKYQLKIYMQGIQTTQYYETTNKGCFLITDYPRLNMRVGEIENDTIKSFSMSSDYSWKYNLIKQ